MREESRGGHTRDDFPAMSPEWRQVNLICSLNAAGDGIDVVEQPMPPMRPDLLALFEKDELKKYFTDEEIADVPTRRRPDDDRHGREVSTGRGDATPRRGRQGYDAHFRVWRGDADGGELVDYTVEVNEGEVVLDIIHRLQATQAGDLAVRWNCKAGKCGSCSAEINGRPRLMCMTRMSTFTEDEIDHRDADAHVPGDEGPRHRRVVQLQEGPGGAGVRAAARPRAGRVPDGAGRRRALAGVPQVHRVLPVPGRLPRHP